MRLDMVMCDATQAIRIFFQKYSFTSFEEYPLEFDSCLEFDSLALEPTVTREKVLTVT